MKEQRLLKVATLLEGLPPEQFWFGSVVQDFDEVHKCASKCCSMGWTPLLWPKLVEWFKYGEYYDVRLKNGGMQGYVMVAQVIFNIDYNEANVLFTPNYVDDSLNYLGLYNLNERATAKDVAKNIRIFVKNRRKK